MASTPSSLISVVRPTWAVEGGRITIEGAFPVDAGSLPQVRIGAAQARVVRASPRALSVVVPAGLEGGAAPVRIDGSPGETAFIEIGVPVATGLHQVDNPVFDREGNLYLTYSGSRGQQTPVSIYRVHRDGAREPFVTGITNATSMAIDAAGRFYVSSRFDGSVYRVAPGGSFEPVATELGIACGLAFDAEGNLYVGDRSGTVFQIDRTGRASAFATLPPSVAAFHLAMGPSGDLYVTAPTLSSYDAVYRIDRAGRVETIYAGFGRPQGLTFDPQGRLYVVEALAGACGVYRLPPGGLPEQALSAPSLVGLAFDPTSGDLIVASNDTAYRLAVSRPGAPRVM